MTLPLGGCIIPCRKIDIASARPVHVPFCRHKCSYCSFVSYSHRESDIPAYVSALQGELALSAAGQRVSSLYFGGGTPSLLSSQQIGKILSTIRFFFKVNESAETTLEANPGTVDRPYLTAIRASGVNRLSLGVQSLHDDELKLLGRIHTSAEARSALRCARRAGFSNLNLDLIYGVPGQTLSSWQNTLNEAIELGKIFSTEKSAAFLNGVLDKMLKHVLNTHRDTSSDQPDQPPSESPDTDSSPVTE